MLILSTSFHFMVGRLLRLRNHDPKGSWWHSRELKMVHEAQPSSQAWTKGFLCTSSPRPLWKVCLTPRRGGLWIKQVCPGEKTGRSQFSPFQTKLSLSLPGWTTRAPATGIFLTLLLLWGQSSNFCSMVSPTRSCTDSKAGRGSWTLPQPAAGASELGGRGTVLQT